MVGGCGGWRCVCILYTGECMEKSIACLASCLLTLTFLASCLTPLISLRGEQHCLPPCTLIAFNLPLFAS